MFDLKGKTALITGSGQGIGKSTALLLAKQGAKVIINWRSNDEVAAKTIEELKAQGADFLTWKYDLSKPTVKADFEAFMKENDITVDILVLNASVQIRNAWENIPVGYIGQPDEIAATILLLCSKEGGYITGTDIPVDGGMSIPFT